MLLNLELAFIFSVFGLFGIAMGRKLPHVCHGQSKLCLGIIYYSKTLTSCRLRGFSGQHLAPDTSGE
jgi:hypothetical protein